jgi:polysaccharide pyruvyl transferase WcaK-like protein
LPDKTPYQVSEYSDNIEKLNGMYSNLDILIGMQFHALVLALKNRVPIVALAYNPKVSALMEEINLKEYCLELGSVTEQSICSMITKILSSKERVASKIADAVFHQQEAALAGFKYLNEALAG